jgi:pyruvate/oxaloacetate carboxyltransferase
VASGASQVDETTLSEKDDVTSVFHKKTVNLGLDVLHALGVLLQPRNVNLNVEVANVYGRQLIPD